MKIRHSFKEYPEIIYVDRDDTPVTEGWFYDSPKGQCENVKYIREDLVTKLKEGSKIIIIKK